MEILIQGLGNIPVKYFVSPTLECKSFREINSNLWRGIRSSSFGYSSIVLGQKNYTLTIANNDIKFLRILNFKI